MSSVVINDTLPRSQFVATSGQTIFDTNWTADATTDVKVYARADGVDADDDTQLVDTTDYTVSLVGGSEYVRVTFLSGRTLSDIVTIIRDTPYVRSNTYTNTNFTPSMLNGDFGRVVMWAQQNKLDRGEENGVGVRYNYSEDLTLPRDQILPKLPANHLWIKNAGDTAITTIEARDAIAAPYDSYYVLTQEDTLLTNSTNLGGGSFTTGLIKNTVSGGAATLSTAVEGTDYYQPGGTDVAVADGGTGASDAATARVNLGLEIGVDVQAYNANLDSISALGTAADKMIYTTGVATWAETALTAFARTLLDDATAADARTTLGIPATTTSLTQDHIIVGDASNLPQDVAMSGDVAIVAAGTTTIQSSFLSGKSDTVIASGDYILFGDADDSNNLKKDTADGLLDLYASKTATLTNKTFDVDGTGNTLSNIKWSNFGTDAQDYLGITNGALLDPITIDVASSGTVITFTMDNADTPGNDIRIKYSDGVTTLTTLPHTATLTEGTDTTPVKNYIYVLKGATVTNSLTASTTGWPNAEYAPIATVVCQSAASMATQLAYSAQAWTDHLVDTDGQGHLTDINYWIRQQYATWVEGTALTPTDGVGTLDVAVATGTVLQLHPHTFPSRDTSGGDLIYCANYFGDNFKDCTDLTLSNLANDANGNALGGASTDYYNLVIWGNISENSNDCKIMVNVPNGAYPNNSNSQAENDTDGTAVYTIPSDFKNTGFLIARLTVYYNGGTYTVIKNTDLRGDYPPTAAGSGSSSTSVFVDSAFRIVDNGDDTKQIAFEASGITSSTTRTLTVQDADGTIAYTSDIPTVQAYDSAFIAGYTSDFSDEDLVVQTYGRVVMARSGSILGESGYLHTVATGAAVIVDIEKNGTSVYSSKPQFAISTNTLSAGTLQTDGTEDFVAGDVLTFKVTQIGSTIAGAAMEFTVKAETSI